MSKAPAGKAPAKTPAKRPPKAAAKDPARRVAKAPAAPAAKTPSAATPRTAGKPAVAAPRTTPRPAPARLHPRSVPILPAESGAEPAPEALFAGSPQESIDPDLRYRMISDVAYRRYVERGYTDGGDVDDWLEAEAEVEQLLARRGAADAGEA